MTSTMTTAIPVAYWPNRNGDWSASCPNLEVVAEAESEAAVIQEMMDLVEERYQILNDKYETLSPSLRAQVDYRMSRSLVFYRWRVQYPEIYWA